MKPFNHARELVIPEEDCPAVKKRFDKFVLLPDDPNDDDACHVWTGAQQGNGYGRFSLYGKPELAHRVRYALTHGRVPEDQMVLHSCGRGQTAGCVRDEHLYLGDNSDNQKDRALHGNSTKGEGMGKAAVVSEEQALEIIRLREVGLKRGEIIKTLDLTIDESQVGRISNGRSWKHLKR